MPFQVIDETPVEKKTRVICGKTLVEWEHAIVYVHNKLNPNKLPTHLHFVFQGRGKALTTEVIRLVDQWTYYGEKTFYTYAPTDHEYYRARKMAISVVETYRSKYIKLYGGPPNSLGLGHTFGASVIKKATDKVNQKAKERITGQTEFVF